jgi:hypothetical protein
MLDAQFGVIDVMHPWIGIDPIAFLRDPAWVIPSAADPARAHAPFFACSG